MSIRSLVAAAAFVASVDASLLRGREDPEAPGHYTEDPDFLTAPEGIAFTGDPASVECSDPDVDISKKEILATIFECDAKAPAEKDMVALCQPYMKGGCDNEICHKFCHSNYISHNEYMDCKCKHWGDKAQFKDYSPGAPCPLKVQPRCYKGSLYRSQCTAQHDNPDVSIDEFTSIQDTEWPEGDMSEFIPSHAACAGF